MVPVTADAQRQNQITAKDLHHWQILRGVNTAIQRVFARAELPASLTDPARKLHGEAYLSLFLLGLFNPVVESMRGLCGISRLSRVQQAVGCGRVSPGSFSEIQHVLEPELMRQVFREVLADVPVSARAEPSLQHLNIILQDGRQE